jgi:hypothetical protein
VPIPVPNLDDRKWTDLVEEGRDRIPACAPEWTDHNASDPGITLIELFAYFTEMLVYRSNRISRRHLRAFLRLLIGPDVKHSGPIDERLRDAIRGLADVERAVTAADYELLAGRVHGVGRAYCLPQRNLSSAHPAAATTEAPGHVSVLILPETAEEAPHRLLESVRHALDAARMVGTRLHVRSPKFITVRVRATLQVAPGVSPEDVRLDAIQSLTDYFDPLRGKYARWPLGRSVYVSEVCQALQQVRGVVVARKTIDPLTRRPVDFLSVAPDQAERLKYNRLQELEAVELRQDELVRIAVDETMFKV